MENMMRVRMRAAFLEIQRVMRRVGVLAVAVARSPVNRYRQSAGMLAVCMLSACDRARAVGSAGSDTPEVVSMAMVPITGTRDTVNGIERINFDASAFEQTAQWTLDTSAVTIAGGVNVDPDYDLTDTYTALLFSDGGIATFALVGAKLFMFSASGKPERKVGRMGQGPGEFTSPGAPILLRGDSLLILDSGNKRLNWISRSGKFATMKKLPAGPPFGVTPLGILPNGELLVNGGGNIVGNAKGDTVERSMSAIQLMTIAEPALSSPRTIASVPHFQLKRVETKYRGRSDTHTTVLGFTLHAITTVWDSSLVTGDGATYQLDVRNLDGQVVRQLHVAVPRRPVTQVMRDTMIARQLKQFEGPQSERMVDANESRRLARDAPFADSLPAFHQTFVSPNGTLWVVDGMSLNDTTWSATAFNREGVMVGRVHAPGLAFVMAFGDDRVLLRVEDTDGVVSMRVHKLVTATRP